MTHPICPVGSVPGHEERVVKLSIARAGLARRPSLNRNKTLFCGDSEAPSASSFTSFFLAERVPLLPPGRLQTAALSTGAYLFSLRQSPRLVLVHAVTPPDPLTNYNVGTKAACGPRLYLSSVLRSCFVSFSTVYWIGGYGKNSRSKQKERNSPINLHFRPIRFTLNSANNINSTTNRSTRRKHQKAKGRLRPAMLCLLYYVYIHTK